MTEILLSALSPEEKKELKKQLRDDEIAEKEAKQKNKESLKVLENEVALKHVDYFIFNRNDIEKGIIELFKDLEPIIDSRCEVYGNKKREQDTHTLTLDDGSASIRTGWNVKPSFNGTESEGLVKIKEFMSSLAGDSENEKLLMDFLNIALKTDNQGNYNPKKVRELNTMKDKAKSDLFNEGMDIVNKAIIDIRTSRFVRGYKMVDFGNGIAKRVNFNFSID
ncbi:hypothetical protein CLU96_1892 [Chryseobacterium sp. 52]|uniref:hypothetical protein n=1 Tax=Chryseobacterium sp. 52 TaxID=2035213 RepID=UPI000C18954F|nr:hypothetical protein [Chryseobacterium sp. 52]PIF44896.1 hypothetical protein CLU96_1892 [Chryseobacterium sp. 52]